MTALFGNAAVADSKNLVQFRCGKMHLKGTTVTADKRKGLLYIYQSDDSLMHFCWKDRTSGVIEDDLIIFPDDTEFKKLPACTTGRAFILKFKSSTRKFFFWMQEPKDDKDEDHSKKVNDLLNNPPAPGSMGGGSAGAGAAGGLAGLQPALASLGDQLGDSSLQRMLSNMDQGQLMQLLGMSGLGGPGGAGGFGGDSRASSRSTTAASTARETPATPATAAASAVTAATPAATPAATSIAGANTPAAPSKPAANSNRPGSAGVQLSDLQSILSNMQGIPGMGSLGGTAPENVDLATSFTSEALLPLLADKSVQTRLAPFLPEAKDLPENPTELRETLQSAQFKQALSTFSAALCSGQLGPLMAQFKLGDKAVQAAAKGDIVEFVKALQEFEQSSATDDEDMALD